MKFHDRPWTPLAKALRKIDFSNDPFVQLELWFKDAIASNIPEINAMTLATATKSGKPSCRTVLLKEFDSKGLIFYTNYESRKAKEISENPAAMVTIFWPFLLRQISIEGRVEKISREESDAYFFQRSRGSQLGAWASQQGKLIRSRKDLENKFRAIKEKFEGKVIPCPPFWGGFRLVPFRFEYWQGGADRLHDRLCYIIQDGSWIMERLSP